MYTFLHGLNPPLRGASGGGPSAAAEIAAPAAAEVTRGSQPAAAGDTATATMLMQQADDAQERGDFVTAKTLLATVRGLMKAQYPDRPEDPTLLQRLALATYKSKYPTAKQALDEAAGILRVLEPETSNDTETLGLWGAVQKRLWEETHDMTYLNQAVRAYERGFYLRNDYYNGINLAYLLNVRAANPESRADAISCFVHAERIRKEVLSICKPLLDEKNLSDAAKYWVRATMAEAYVGLGDESNANQILQEAYQFSPEGWMKSSTEEQLTKLRSLLVDSPLKYVKDT